MEPRGAVVRRATDLPPAGRLRGHGRSTRLSRYCAIGDGDVVELLSSLIDKSLVHRIAADSAEPHFAMLQSVLAFAVEQLAESGDLEIDGRPPPAALHGAGSRRRVLRIATSEESAWWEAISGTKATTGRRASTASRAARQTR